MNCEGCRYYWTADNGNTEGQCRRYPPRVFNAPVGTIVSRWPAVALTMWCGEWGRGWSEEDEREYLEGAFGRIPDMPCATATKPVNQEGE